MTAPAPDDAPARAQIDPMVADLQAEPPPAAAASAGALLARARAAQGISIEDVARQLKFAPRQIEALEADRHEVLPGAAAVRGMVRSYARLLRIDAAPLLETLADRLAVPDADRLAARYGEPVPFSDGARRSTFVYVALSVAVLAVAALVLFEWRQTPAPTTQMSFVPAAQAPLETSRTATDTTPAPGETAPAPLAAARPPNEPVRTELASAAASPAPAQTPAATAQEGKPAAEGARDTQSAAPGAAPAAATGSHRIALRFERDSWVEVRDGAGRVLMSKVNAAQSEAVISGEPPFSLVIGNAQYVHLTYDAKAIDLEPHIKVAVARLTLP
ncbi:MAG TPA: helix-turn-helix domain-containing protein [Burkholderiales bacterium]